MNDIKDLSKSHFCDQWANWGEMESWRIKDNNFKYFRKFCCKVTEVGGEIIQSEKKNVYFK